MVIAGAVETGCINEDELIKQAITVRLNFAKRA
jgi:hypothetical protein